MREKEKKGKWNSLSFKQQRCKLKVSDMGILFFAKGKKHGYKQK